MSGLERSAGAVKIDVKADRTRFRNDMRANRSTLKKFKDAAIKAARAIKQNWKIVIASIAGFGVAIGAALKKMADYSSSLVEAARTTGLTTKELERLRSLFKGDGIGIERTDKAMQEFNVRIGFAQRGIGQYTRAFEKLGISMKREDGTFKNQKELLTEVATKLQGASSQSEAASIAYELFGRAGKELLPILLKHGSALDDNAKKANRFRTVSDEQHKLNKDMGQEFTNLTDNVVDLIQRGLSPMAPAVTGAIQSINEMIIALKDGFEEAGRIIAKVIGWIGDLFSQQWRTDIDQLAKNLERIAKLEESLATGDLPEIAGYKDYAGTRQEVARLKQENLAIRQRMEERREALTPSIADEGSSSSSGSSSIISVRKQGRDMEEGVKSHQQRLKQARGVARRKAEEAQRRGEESYREALFQAIYDFNDSAAADPGQFSPMRVLTASRIGKATRPYQGRHYDTAALKFMMDNYNPSTFIRDRRNARAAENQALYDQDTFTTMIENALHGPIETKPKRNIKYHTGGVQFGEGVLEAFKRGGQTSRWYESLEETKELASHAALNAKHSYDIVRLKLNAVDMRGRRYSPEDIERMNNSDIQKYSYAGRVYSPIERIRMQEYDMINRGGPYAGRSYSPLEVQRMKKHQSIYLNAGGPYAGRSYSHQDRTNMAMAEIHGVDEGLKLRLEEIKEMTSDVRGEFEGWFTSMFEGFTNTRDAAEDLLGILAKMAAQRLVLEPLANVLFGGYGGEKDKGGLLGIAIGGVSSWLGGLFGSGATPNPHTRANGGIARGMTLVGERGPELVDFSTPGMVTSNEKIRAAMGATGGSGIVINNYISSTDGPGVQRALSTAMPGFIASAQTAVAEAARRPGNFRANLRGAV